MSWLVGDTRVSKKTLHSHDIWGGYQFVTDAQKAANIWLRENRHRIEELVSKATIDQLKAIDFVLTGNYTLRQPS